MDLIDRILDATRVGERTGRDSKSARNQARGSFWATHCALASNRLHQVERPDSSHLPADSSHLALQEIALPVARSGKVPTEVMDRTLCALCSGRFLTVEELGRLVNRSAANLRSRYLSRLVRAGRLRPRFPEATHRPDQAYTAVEERE